MDAAERSFVARGYRVSTMEVIARDAGYSRSAMYRHFPTRRRLVEAMVERTTQRHMASILDRLPEDDGPVPLLVESLIIVATELVHDPLLNTIAEQSEEGTVASIIANDAGLTELVEPMIETIVANDTDGIFRQGLRPHDLTRYVIATAMGMLLHVIPDIDEPQAARRYIETFVLPVILEDPPRPQPVFRAGSDGRRR